MNMVSELIQKLRKYENFVVMLSDYTCKLLKQAADMIEDLSAKVASQNMERSSQYDGGGWVPVDERLPEDGKAVLVWYEYFRYGEHNCMFQTYRIGYQFDGHWSGDVSGIKARCIAWQPLPQNYYESRVEGGK